MLPPTTPKEALLPLGAAVLELSGLLKPVSTAPTVNVVAVAPELKVPQVLITRDQYFQDIKVRWEIHQYEVNKLREDVSKFTQTVAPYVKNALDYVVTQYQQIRAKYATN